MRSKDLHLAAKLSGKPVKIYTLHVEKRYDGKMWASDIKREWMKAFLIKKEAVSYRKEMEKDLGEWYLFDVVELELS